MVFALFEGEGTAGQDDRGVRNTNRDRAIVGLFEAEIGREFLAAHGHGEVGTDDPDDTRFDQGAAANCGGVIENFDACVIGSRIDFESDGAGYIGVLHTNEVQRAVCQHQVGVARLGDLEVCVEDTQADSQRVDLGSALTLVVFEEERTGADEEDDVCCGQSVGAPGCIGFDADEVADDQADAATEHINERSVDGCDFVGGECDLEYFAAGRDGAGNTGVTGVDAKTNTAAKTESFDCDFNITRQQAGKAISVEDECTPCIGDGELVGVLIRRVSCGINLEGNGAERHDGDGVGGGGALLLERQVAADCEQADGEYGVGQSDPDIWSSIELEVEHFAVDSYVLANGNIGRINLDLDLADGETEALFAVGRGAAKVSGDRH